MSEKGKFIVIEGVNGAGATTHMNSLREELEMLGRKPVVTESRSCGDLGKMVIEAWKFGNDFKTDFEIECAGRTRLYHSVILPNLLDGNDVFCRHYTPSSMVNVRLKGFGIKMENECRFIEGWARGEGKAPDLVILLDASLETVMMHKGKDLEKVSPADMELLRRKRDLYHEEVKHYNHIVIDANRDKAEVRNDVIKAAFAFLGIVKK